MDTAALSYSPTIAGQYENIDIEAIHEMVISGSVRYEVGLIRKYKRSHSETQKAMAKVLKKRLPVFCGSTFRHSTTEKTNRTYAKLINTNYLILDIDHMTAPEDVEGYAITDFMKDMEECDELIYRTCMFGFKSPSGDGMKLIYRLSRPVEDTGYYKRVFQHMCRELTKSTGLVADKSGSDQTRACFVSYDPGAWWAPDRVLDLDEIELEIDVDEELVLPSIELWSRSQIDIFLKASEYIRVFHYQEFRNTCSAASRLCFLDDLITDLPLRKIYETLLENNFSNLSAETRTALKQRKEQYIKSFMAEHSRLPLQLIIDEAVKNGYVFPNIPRGKNTPLFKMTDIFESVVDYMNDRYCVVNDGADIACLPEKRERRYFDLSNRGSTLESKFNTIRIVKRIDKKEDLSNKKVWWYNEKGELKSTPWFDLWWSSSRRRSAKVLTSSPMEKPRAGTLSTWVGYNVDPDRLSHYTDPKLCEPILDFFHSVIAGGDTESYEFLINWVSEMLKNPTPKKPGVALVLRGGEGVGKGTFSDILMDIIGLEHSVLIGDIENINTFNAIIDRKLLITLDEAFFSGDRRTIKKIMGMITGSDIVVNEKNVRQYVTDNIARFLMLSNEHHIVHMANDARRYMVFDVPGTHKDDYKYWSQLRKCMAEGGKETLYRYLIEREVDYDYFDVRRKPETQAAIHQKRASFNDFDRYVEQLFVLQRIGDILLNFESPTEISLVYLLANFQEFTGKSKYKMGVDEFRQRAIGFFDIGKVKTGLCEHTKAYSEIWTIPALNELAGKHPLHAGVFHPQRDTIERSIIKTKTGWRD